MIKVKFMQYDCVAQFGRYSNNRNAIQLLDEVTGEPIAKATVNLDGVKIAPDEVAIKNYAENKGMLVAMVAAGIVSTPVRYESLIYPMHTIQVPICKLLKREGPANS